MKTPAAGLRSIAMIGCLTVCPASQSVAVAAETLRLEVRETAGIRRFGYPVALKLPEISLDAANAHFCLRDGGRSAPAQFRREQTEGGGSLWWLDFNLNMPPNGVRILTLEYGPDVVADPEPHGLELKQTPDGFEIHNAPHLVWSVGRDLQRLLTSLSAGELEHLRPEGLRLGIEGPQGVVYARSDEMGLPQVIRSGPLAVAIRCEFAPKAGQLAGTSSTVELTFPVSKSWVQVGWRIDDPRQVVKCAKADIFQKLDPPTKKEPTLVDFGASSLVYMALAPGTAGALKASILEPRTPVRQSWEVLRGARAPLESFVVGAGGPGSGEAEGWSHVMDRHRCLALAVDGFGKRGQDSIEVAAEGEVTIARRFPTGGADLSANKNIRFWLHFVGFPPHLTAVTSPQSMLSPLIVRIKKP